MPTTSTSTAPFIDFDIIIIGAGISGINAAYRIQDELRNCSLGKANGENGGEGRGFGNFSYTILEARDRLGGTWDLFRYPGIRSDSDLHTFGFAWRPWKDPKCIADGKMIRDYLEESAAETGIDKMIQYRHKVNHANWSSDQSAWELDVDADGTPKKIVGRFIIMASGYYDYHNPMAADIPGLNRFKGMKVHPQFWPENLNWTNKNIVVIGSGATAVTLLPAMVDKAKKITMLQRSPSYIMSRPEVDGFGQWTQRILPEWLSFRLVRFKYLVLPFIFFKFCRAFPNAARAVLKKATQRDLKANIPIDPHFMPTYKPWDQRVCVCPEGDFFRAFDSGKADIVTDTIKTVTEKGIETTNGTYLPADIIVTATGLKMQIGGGATMSIDGKPVQVSDKFIWKGLMLQDLPNIAAVIGYTNASWTLGADATALHVTRLLKFMKENGYVAAVPKVDDEDRMRMKEQPLLNLASTYVSRAKRELPKAGDIAPWKPRGDYFRDLWEAKYGDMRNGLKFEKAVA